MILALVLCVVACIVGCYLRAVTLRAVQARRKQAVAPNYFRIRTLERDLNMEPTPFPDWLPKVRVPDAIARDLGMTDPLVTWGEAAEVFESYCLANGMTPTDFRL